MKESVEYIQKKCDNCATAVNNILILLGNNETTKTDTGFEFIFVEECRVEGQVRKAMKNAIKQRRDHSRL